VAKQGAQLPARDALPGEILLSTAHLYKKSHLKRLAIQLNDRMILKVTQGHKRDLISHRHHFLLVIYSNNVSILHHFWVITAFAVHVRSFRFDKTDKNYTQRTLSHNYGRPMEYLGIPLYFRPVVSSFFFFFLFFFPRLISAVGDWMSAILPHTVWP